MIVLIVVCHNYIRKFGEPCLRSFRRHHAKIICFDNESRDSELAERVLRPLSDVFFRVHDQEATGGLTGAWNAGLAMAADLGAEAAALINHDVLASPSWPEIFVNMVHGTLYGPLSNDPGDTWRYQMADGPRPGHPDIKVPKVNGFCMAAAMQTWELGRFDEHHYFDPAYPFGGNESEFQKRLHLRGGKSMVRPRSWVFHWKNLAWRDETPKYPDPHL